MQEAFFRGAAAENRPINCVIKEAERWGILFSMITIGYDPC